MATAYGVICDVLKFSDIYPTIIYIDFVVNMHGNCIILNEIKCCVEVKNHPKQVSCERASGVYLCLEIISLCHILAQIPTGSVEPISICLRRTSQTVDQRFPSMS